MLDVEATGTVSTAKPLLAMTGPPSGLTTVHR
jgi:hypothetical protein